MRLSTRPLALAAAVAAAGLADFVARLAATPEGDQALLDRVLVVYGSGLSDGDRHTHEDLPVLLVGGRLVVGGGRHLALAPETPMTNLFLTLLDHLGVPAESFGDSTGGLSLC